MSGERYSGELPFGDEMTPGEILLLVVGGFGYVGGFVIHMVNRHDNHNDSPQESFGRGILWPLFALKWIALSLRKGFVALFTT